MGATTGWVRGGTATVLLAMALLATGCGSDEPRSPAAAPSPSPGREAYLECLRKNGVEPGRRAGNAGGGDVESDPSAAPDEGASAAPDEGGDAAGEGGKGRRGSPELRKARRACRSLAPRPDPATVAAAKAFRKCMKEHGVTLGKGARKDDNEGEGEQKEQGEGVRPGDPEFAAAVKECRPLRKSPQPSAPASPGS